MFQHRHPVGRRERDRAARPALADDDADERHPDLQAFLGRARDRLALPAFLGALAGIGAGGVHQRDDRQAEAVGHVHQADRLAVALGAGHAEVAEDARLGVVALFVADHHHRLIAEPGEAAHHRVVVAEGAVARQRGPFGKQRVHVVAAVRAVGVARDQRLAPRIERPVQLAELVGRLLVQRRRFLFQVHALALARERAQFLGLALEVGERLFELQISHGGAFSLFAALYAGEGGELQRSGARGAAQGAGPTSGSARPRRRPWPRPSRAGPRRRSRVSRTGRGISASPSGNRPPRTPRGGGGRRWRPS